MQGNWYMELGRSSFINRRKMAIFGAAMTGLALTASSCSAPDSDILGPDSTYPSAVNTPNPEITADTPPEEPDCDKPEDDGEKIICTAEKYKGIYYRFGGAHDLTIDEYNKGCPDPKNPKNNKPHKFPNSDKPWGRGNPSPCGFDSTGFMWVVLNNALDTDHPHELAADLPRDKNFKTVHPDKVKRGDIGVIPGQHAEFVRYKKDDVAYTIGVRRTGTAVSHGAGKFPIYMRYVPVK